MEPVLSGRMSGALFRASRASRANPEGAEQTPPPQRPVGSPPAAAKSAQASSPVTRGNSWPGALVGSRMLVKARGPRQLIEMGYTDRATWRGRTQARHAQSKYLTHWARSPAHTSLSGPSEEQGRRPGALRNGCTSPSSCFRAFSLGHWVHSELDGRDHPLGRPQAGRVEPGGACGLRSAGPGRRR